MPSWTSVFRRVVIAGACLSGVLALGCAGRNRDQLDGYPSQPGRQIIAQPGGYEDVYVADQRYVEQAPADGRQVVGYDTLSDGSQVEVVQYVHTYPEQIETYPRVYWANNWYYNVNGDFVYWSPAYGGWVYYWGPPAPLVSCWNLYYPWAPYYWGVGFYGAGWYWGGVGYYGYHAYGLPVVNQYNHHHHYWADANSGGSSTRPSSGHPGGPTNDPSPGGPTSDGPPHRTKPDQAPVAHRTKPGDTSPARGEPARRDPASAAPTRTGDRVAGAAPQRTTATKPTRTVPVRTYTTAGGQRVTTIDPGARVAATRTAPPPTRTSKSLGTVTSGPARDPFASSSAPRWDQPAASTPTRSGGWDRSPSRSFSSSPSPSRTAAPSRSFSPSPSRSSAPSSSPSRSFSPPSRSSAPSSSPSRSFSPPSRSSAPSRSFSPSRS
ncbi:MAG TPA: hypothetical protein VFG69_15675, partial [Nannocystaceae bacterium]|nr:hypothetical protein [Nannocystaceae bacterium]